MTPRFRRTTVRDLGRAELEEGAGPKRTRRAAIRAALMSVPVPARVWAFSVFLALAAVALYMRALDGRGLDPPVGDRRDQNCGVGGEGGPDRIVHLASGFDVGPRDAGGRVERVAPSGDA